MTLSNETLSNQILEQIKLHTGNSELNFFQVYKNPKGTRFTNLGYAVAKKIWQSYPVKFKKDYRVLNKTLLMLDQRMTWPYYLGKTSLVLFNEMDAFEFTLYQGDINLWSNKS